MEYTITSETIKPNGILVIKATTKNSIDVVGHYSCGRVEGRNSIREYINSEQIKDD